MLIKKPSDIRPSEITDPEVYHKRREFLRMAAVAGVGAGSAAAIAMLSGSEPVEASVSAPGKLPAVPNLKSTEVGTDLTPTDYDYVTGYNNFYEFGTGKSDPAENAHSLQTRPWEIVVDGECEAPGRIGMDDILNKFAQEERTYRLRCVEAWAMVVPWVGFSVADLLKTFKPTSKAKYVRFETLVDPKTMPGQKRAVLDWPYVEGLRMDEAMHPLATLATGLYGEILPNQNGAPIRLVVPWKYGFKSIKSIVRISFTEKMPATTWALMAPHEYGFYANVNPEVDHPRWSQARHRIIGEGLFAKKHDTLMFNGYADQVASLYSGMNLRRHY